MLQQEASERVTAQAAGGVLQPTATASPQKGLSWGGSGDLRAVLREGPGGDIPEGKGSFGDGYFQKGGEREFRSDPGDSLAKELLTVSHPPFLWEGQAEGKKMRG